MTTTNATSIRGILIPANSPHETVEISTEETWRKIQTAIGADHFTVCACRDGIDLYVDDEGLINGSAFNMPLTIVAHTLGYPAAIFGDGLALRVDEDGESQSLTEEQAAAVTAALSTTPPPREVLESIVELLSPHPRFDPFLDALLDH